MNELESIKIENMIYEIRGKQVMLDSDVAVKASLKIVDIFINMRKFINENKDLFKRFRQEMFWNK